MINETNLKINDEKRAQLLYRLEEVAGMTPYTRIFFLCDLIEEVDRVITKSSNLEIKVEHIIKLSSIIDDMLIGNKISRYLPSPMARKILDKSLHRILWCITTEDSWNLTEEDYKRAGGYFEVDGIDVDLELYSSLLEAKIDLAIGLRNEYVSYIPNTADIVKTSMKNEFNKGLKLDIDNFENVYFEEKFNPKTKEEAELYTLRETASIHLDLVRYYAKKGYLPFFIHIMGKLNGGKIFNDHILRLASPNIGHSIIKSKDIFRYSQYYDSYRTEVNCEVGDFNRDKYKVYLEERIFKDEESEEGLGIITFGKQSIKMKKLIKPSISYYSKYKNGYELGFIKNQTFYIDTQPVGRLFSLPNDWNRHMPIHEFMEKLFPQDNLIKSLTDMLEREIPYLFEDYDKEEIFAIFDKLTEEDSLEDIIEMSTIQEYNIMNRLERDIKWLKDHKLVDYVGTLDTMIASYVAVIKIFMNIKYYFMTQINTIYYFLNKDKPEDDYATQINSTWNK